MRMSSSRIIIGEGGIVYYVIDSNLKGKKKIIIDAIIVQRVKDVCLIWIFTINSKVAVLGLGIKSFLC